MRKIIFLDLNFCDLESHFVDFAVLDLREKETELLQKDHEGYRQVLNYFGEEYLKQNEELNVKKLFNFVFSSYQKLRIYIFMIAPILTNEIVKFLDKNKTGNILILGDYFVEKNFARLVDKVVFCESSNEKSILIKKCLGLPEKIELKLSPGKIAEELHKILKMP